MERSAASIFFIRNSENIIYLAAVLRTPFCLSWKYKWRCFFLEMFDKPVCQICLIKLQAIHRKNLSATAQKAGLQNRAEALRSLSLPDCCMAYQKSTPKVKTWICSSCQDCLFIICLLPAGKAFPAAIMPVLTRQGKYSSGERGMPVSSICVLADKDIEKLDGKERFTGR